MSADARAILPRLALVLALAAAVAGCATATGRPGAADRTGGLALEVRTTGPGGRVELMRVRRDGAIEFAGGRDAIVDRVSWTGTLTDAEIAELRARLDRERWREGDFAPVRPAPPPDAACTYRIRLEDPEGRRRYTVEGPHPRVEPVRAVLAEACTRRLDPDFARYPEPGPLD